MKMPSTENYFKRVTAVYLIDDTTGAVHVESKTLSLLVPNLGGRDLEEAHLVAQAKRIIAAEHDVEEQHICVVGVGTHLGEALSP
jgi:hypothetical protein